MGNECNAIWASRDIITQICAYAGPDATFTLSRTSKSLNWVLNDDIWSLFTADIPPKYTSFLGHFDAYQRYQTLKQVILNLFKRTSCVSPNPVVICALLQYVKEAPQVFANLAEKPLNLSCWFWATWLINVSARTEALELLCPGGLNADPLTHPMNADLLQMLVSLYMIRLGRCPPHIKSLNKYVKVDPQRFGSELLLAQFAAQIADDAKCDVLGDRLLVRAAVFNRLAGGLVFNKLSPLVALNDHSGIDMETLKPVSIDLEGLEPHLVNIQSLVQSIKPIEIGYQATLTDIAQASVQPLLKNQALIDRCLTYSGVHLPRKMLPSSHTNISSQVGLILQARDLRMVVLDYDGDSLLVISGTDIFRMSESISYEILHPVPTYWLNGLELPFIDADLMVLGQFFSKFDKRMSRFILSMEE